MLAAASRASRGVGWAEKKKKKLTPDGADELGGLLGAKTSGLAPKTRRLVSERVDWPEKSPGSVGDH